MSRPSDFGANIFFYKLDIFSFTEQLGLYV